MEDILVVSIIQSYRNGMNEEEIKEASSKAWYIKDRSLNDIFEKEKIKYLVSIYSRKIKGIYRVLSARTAINNDWRVEFEIEDVKDKDLKEKLENKFNGLVFKEYEPVKVFNSKDL